MKGKICRLVVVAGIIATSLLSWATPAYATTPYPDSDPTVDQIDIYRHLRETGDMLVVVYANIPYAVPPSLPITETYIWQFVDTDDVTIFASTTGYAYNNNGYGYNVYSFYLTAADVTSYAIVWGTSYTIRLRGNPSAFTTSGPRVYNYVVNALDYDASTTMAEAQAALADRILIMADDLDREWGLTSTTTLLQEGEAGVFLSIRGSAFFRGAIYGVQAMAPTAFDVVIRVVDIEARDWSDNYSANLTTMYTGTWVDTARAAGAALFGTTYDLMTIIIVLMCVVGLAIGNVSLSGDAWNGLVDVSLFAVIGARLAFYDMGFLMLVAAVAWFYISAKLWFGIVR